MQRTKYGHGSSGYGVSDSGHLLRNRVRRELIKVVPLMPVRLVCRHQFSSRDLAFEREHEVCPLVVPAIHTNKPAYLDQQPRFFSHLSHRRVVGKLVDLHSTTRKVPQVGIASMRKEHLVIRIQYHCECANRV